MNRLADAASPYLRQHAGNPVDWYPWGEEALERARSEDRPILLSIGYAACHWCHVMAHESFEDPATAALMNELYVNIKVDREERPDLDAIYMQAVQAMTGHGGWPMTVVLTPDGHPYFGGTYFPPEDRHGLPAFRRVLQSVADAYRDRREDVERSTGAVREMYERQLAPARSAGPLSPQLLERAARTIVARQDWARGGFGGAPKFPQTMALDFALRHWRRTGDADSLDLVRRSFRAMARGGIHDQVGGGFHRYTVDASWLVPHFEKMLYDNALLARLGVHLWQATGDAEARRVVEDTVEWVRREMTSPEGGFYSSLDADSEGEEGRFYVWEATGFDAIVDDDAPLLRAYWGVRDAGNFEGRNILHVPEEPSDVALRLGVTEERLAEAVARGAAALYASRARRAWPA
ncbi:MAG: thioredoxin domain-containing protein, partial [Gemmatimonadaceae bacterium]